MYSDFPIFAKLTTGAEADALGTFDDTQLLQIRAVLEAEFLQPDVLRFAQFLMEDYSFDRLLVPDEKKRRRFAFAMAQCWLFTRTASKSNSIMHVFRSCFASPLSTIIDTGYELLIDEVEIVEGLTNKRADDLVVPRTSRHPIDYDKRIETWPFLRQLNDLPASGLKTLVLVANASSIQTNLLEYSRIVSDKSVPEGTICLNKKGLLVLDVPKEELLALFPLQKLRDFAVQNGIQGIPSNKADLIKLVNERCEPVKIISFVNFLLGDPYYGYAKERFMRLSIPNARIFEEYIRDELNRLSLYLESVGCMEHDFPSTIVPVLKPNKRGERPGDPLQNSQSYTNAGRAFSPKSFIARVSPKDLRTIRKYWDEQCDALIATTRAENPNRFAVSVAISKVMSYWDQTGVLQQYQSETRNSAYETHWHWVLSAYVAFQLSLDDRYQLRPIKRVCNGCGCKFVEWSVSLDFVSRVGKNVEFCNACYSHIFNHRFMANTTKASRIPSEDMLTDLWKLSKLLGFIPTRKYMENIELPTQPPERQVEIGSLLLKMPAYDIYIEKFGSWLKCLTLAGVLDDGHRKTSRGIQCLASDGHLCLSLGEKAIDDWLTNHDITHEKEVIYPFDDQLNPNRLARTDWKVDTQYIEYASLMDSSEYAQKMHRKELLAAKHHINLMIVEPADLFRLDEKLASLIRTAL